MVVLPEPLLPKNPNVSPRLTSKLRSSMTLVLPNFIEKWLTVMIESVTSIIISYHIEVQCKEERYSIKKHSPPTMLKLNPD